MRPAPLFRLHDARGGILSSRQLAGRPYAITFLYTKCKDVCPLIGDELRQALALLGARAARVNVVAISVNPHTDTPAAVKRWLRQHREPTNFHYLIGSHAQLRPVWRRYFVGAQTNDTGRSVHSASIWLIDVRGRWRAHFSAGFAVNPADIAHDLRVMIGPSRCASPRSCS
jgi:protein SCO1/2